MYRIAHFSDFHLSAQDENFDYALDLIDDAIDNDADHIVISGDIVGSQQMDVVKAFLTQLSRRKWASADKLTIIPGNHDIYPDLKWKWPARPDKTFKEFTRLTRRQRIGERSDSIFSNKQFPFKKTLNKNVVLAGLETTMNGVCSPISFANGNLEEEDIDAVTEFFDEHGSAKHKILVCHHYPFDTEFFAIRGLVIVNGGFTDPEPEIARNWLCHTGASLVLCGHVHENHTKKLGKNCRMVCAGDGQNGKYYLLDLNTDGTVKIYPQ